MKALVITVMIITISIITFVTFIQPPQAQNVENPNYDVIRAEEGSICKTPTQKTPCEQGLKCLNEDEEEVFDENEEYGYCQNVTSS